MKSILLIFLVSTFTYLSCNSSSNSKQVKTDTANVGGLYSKDTSTMVVRVRIDTLGKWDTIYYVPFDTLYAYKNLKTKKTDSTKLLKVMVSLPRGWMIQDFNSMPK